MLVVKQTKRPDDSPDETEPVPKLVPGDHATKTLSSLTIHTKADVAQFVYSGDNVCWRKSKSESIVQVYNLVNSTLKEFDLMSFSGVAFADKDLHKHLEQVAFYSVDPIS
jgi:hypothetical protein